MYNTKSNLTCGKPTYKAPSIVFACSLFCLAHFC